ncbi:hypothetical protein [Parendozoicomonas sp. Alg238-R29]|uniref:hypothetical protein n=1 Tax=Parendozoicomonas sp. Alg238-R29 TaxID=2993446 RepID=UPI00248D6003|nr:hypothetical protein [Parendozoicomonas sp. Alg238-R29]
MLFHGEISFFALGLGAFNAKRVLQLLNHVVKVAYMPPVTIVRSPIKVPVGLLLNLTDERINPLAFLDQGVLNGLLGHEDFL